MTALSRFLVNFKAFEMRLIYTWRSREGTARQGRQFGCINLQVSSLHIGFESFESLAHQISRVYLMRGKLPASEPGKLQQCIHHFIHLNGKRLNHLKIALSILREGRGILCDQQLGVSCNISQGGPQLVGDRIGKGIQLFQGFLEIFCAL